MVHCWKCGTELRQGAQFCDACGSRMKDVPYAQSGRSDGDIYRSTRYFVGETRVNAAVSAIIGGSSSWVSRCSSRRGPGA